MKTILQKTRELKEILRSSGRPVIEVATCNHQNWDKYEHFIMPYVAKKLIADGYSVTKISHECGVIDYKISLT